jgi:enoyl-CoA hydratase
VQTYTTIELEREEPIVLIALNRPEVLNALNLQMISELDDAFAALDADPAIRAIVLTGRGERAFAAGADIAELSALSGSTSGAELSRRGQALTLRMERMGTPVIVAVNGFALGGGCELAMAGDIRLASENARFGQPEVNLGLIPGYGGTQRTARMLGRGMAMLMCLSGEPIDAQTALQWGLVQRVLLLGELIPEAKRIATTIAAKAPLAIEAVKRAINDGIGIGLPEGMALEALAFGTIVGTEDAREGTKAFLEKRKPSFSGR